MNGGVRRARSVLHTRAQESAHATHTEYTPASNPPDVVLSDVHRSYQLASGAVHAIRGVDLTIGRGESLALMGPSGCGKSTLLHLIGAVDLPTAGSVQVLGQETRDLGDAGRTTLRLHRIGFVFQRFFLLPMLTAAENIALPMMEAGVGRAERDARVAELLSYVGLSDRARHRPSQLSGGEMQRVAVARALANRPRLHIADEPTGELDEATGAEITALLLRVNAGGTTLVLATHNAALALSCGRVMRLRDGVMAG